MATTLRQSDKYACYMRKKGWKVENIKAQIKNTKNGQAIKRGPKQLKAFIKDIPLLGSVIKIQHPSILPSEKTLNKLAKKYKALFIKIEPAAGVQVLDSRISHWERDNWPLLPTKTLHLNLEPPEKELWQDLDSDAQHSIKKAKGVLNVKSYALEEEEEENTHKLKRLHKILKKSGKENRFPAPNWKNLKALTSCFKNSAILIEALESHSTSASGERKEEPIASCLLLIHNHSAYYYYAATTERGRDFLGGYLVLWKAILVAKEKGCTVFDFEGIYDKRYHKQTKTWKGFSYFKGKFGGAPVNYPIPLIKYYSLPIRMLSCLFCR